MVKEKLSPQQDQDEDLSDLKELILFNDEYNTFEFVIETLIEVCGHDHHQAEQCAWITHFNGKCKVKDGTFQELKPLFDEMSVRDLTVSID
jgi:ATP-dependent Clp protease adaptor protein ClpS